MSDGTTQSNSESQSRIAALEAELEQLRQERDRAEHEGEPYRKLYTLVLHELERLKRQLFGKKAESVDPAQVQLAFAPVLEALTRAERSETNAQADVESELNKLRERSGLDPAPARTTQRDGQRSHRRRDLSKEQAPVETIVLEPPERSLPELLVTIGEEVSEHFDYRPRASYACESFGRSTVDQPARRPTAL